VACSTRSPIELMSSTSTRAIWQRRTSRRALAWTRLARRRSRPGPGAAFPGAASGVTVNRCSWRSNE
jgi:hypothetical protein